MRNCSVCRETKDESEFSAKRNSRCRPCNAAYLREWRAQNRESYNAQTRERYHANPEAFRERQREYARAHPEMRQEAWARWYEKNKEQRSEYYKEWRSQPEVKARLQERDRGRYQRDANVSARRLIQQRVQSGAMPPASSKLCWDCDEPASEYDHYLGYTGKAREAVQPVCKPCHQIRTNKRNEVD